MKGKFIYSICIFIYLFIHVKSYFYITSNKLRANRLVKIFFSPLFFTGVSQFYEAILTKDDMSRRQFPSHWCNQPRRHQVCDFDTRRICMDLQFVQHRTTTSSVSLACLRDLFFTDKIKLNYQYPVADTAMEVILAFFYLPPMYSLQSSRIGEDTVIPF